MSRRGRAQGSRVFSLKRDECRSYCSPKLPPLGYYGMARSPLRCGGDRRRSSTAERAPKILIIVCVCMMPACALVHPSTRKPINPAREDQHYSRLSALPLPLPRVSTSEAETEAQKEASPRARVVGWIDVGGRDTFALYKPSRHRGGGCADRFLAPSI